MIVNIQNHGEIFGTLLDISWQVRVTGEISSGTAFFAEAEGSRFDTFFVGGVDGATSIHVPKDKVPYRPGMMFRHCNCHLNTLHEVLWFLSEKSFVLPSKEKCLPNFVMRKQIEIARQR
ncbi:MAG: hypothetical protein GX364_05510 [Firmicutes bacterium]|jgi:hypothetical protein|nr:hypothetical protein [Bacillota bacterium]